MTQEKSIKEMNRGKTEYRIHVKGKVEGDPESIFHTYRCNVRPKDEDEALKIAGDFTTVEKLSVEEVTTITKSRFINLT